MENNMARKGVVILILAGMISSLGCEKGTNNSSSSSGTLDYFPMQLGNTWTYVDTAGGRDAEWSCSIVATSMVGEHEYFVFDKWPPFFPADYVKSGEVIIRKTEHSDVVLRLGDEDILYYKFSDTTLDSMRVVPAGGTKFITHLESIQDTVVTLAGTFNHCYRFLSYVAQVKGNEVRVGFAPQVGPVCIRLLASNEERLLKSAVVDGRYYGTTGVSPCFWRKIKPQCK